MTTKKRAVARMIAQNVPTTAQWYKSQLQDTTFSPSLQEEKQKRSQRSKNGAN